MTTKKMAELNEALGLLKLITKEVQGAKSYLEEKKAKRVEANRRYNAKPETKVKRAEKGSTYRQRPEVKARQVELKAHKAEVTHAYYLKHKARLRDSQRKYRASAEYKAGEPKRRLARLEKYRNSLSETAQARYDHKRLLNPEHGVHRANLEGARAFAGVVQQGIEVGFLKQAIPTLAVQKKASVKKHAMKSTKGYTPKWDIFRKDCLKHHSGLAVIYIWGNGDAALAYAGRQVVYKRHLRGDEEKMFPEQGKMYFYPHWDYSQVVERHRKTFLRYIGRYNLTATKIRTGLRSGAFGYIGDFKG